MTYTMTSSEESKENLVSSRLKKSFPDLSFIKTENTRCARDNVDKQRPEHRDFVGVLCICLHTST